MKVRLIVQVTCHCLLEENWKNEAECTGTEESRKTEFLAVGETCKVLFPSCSRLKGNDLPGGGVRGVCGGGGGGGGEGGRTGKGESGSFAGTSDLIKQSSGAV